MTSPAQLYNIVSRLGKVRVFNAVETNTLRPITGNQINFNTNSISITSMATSDPDIDVVVNTGAVPDRGGYILVSQSNSVAQWEEYITDANIPGNGSTIAGVYSNPDFVLDAQGRAGNLINGYTPWTSWNALAGSNVASILNNASSYRVNGNVIDVSLNVQLSINTGGGTSPFFTIDASNLPIINSSSGGFAVMEEFSFIPPNNILNRYAQMSVSGNNLVFATSFPVDASGRVVNIYCQFRAEAS